jgi:hypothetical protein
MRVAMMVSLTILFAGCDSASPTDNLDFAPVAITPSATDYSPGDVVTLRFTNFGHRPIEMGLCFTGLFRRRADGNFIEDRTLIDVCPSVLQKIDGYSSIVLGARLPNDLAPGQYRLLKEFAVVVDGLSAEVRKLSAQFEVR